MLAQVLSGLPPIDDPDVLVGTATADDAGVYRLSDDLALVQTVDFFTPIVDDPASFGRIAAANALSDIYAMGARPLTALAIAAFPEKGVPIEVLAAILRGGAEKAHEAGIHVIGGHTVKDDEPKYGLAVTGLVHPQRIVRNSTAQPGDALVLTKRIGTGIMTTARRRDLIDDAALAAVVVSMEMLNRGAAELMVAQPGVHAATDISGFGLIGHLQELARGSGVGIRIRSASVPFFEQVLDLAQRDCVPGGTLGNHAAALAGGVQFGSVPQHVQLALCDAQTSGGLLVSLEPEAAEAFVQACHAAGIAEAVVVGNVAVDQAFVVI